MLILFINLCFNLTTIKLSSSTWQSHIISMKETACPVNVWLGKLTALDMTPLGWLGSKSSTQTQQMATLHIWAAKNSRGMCTQRRLRSAWASAQSDQFSQSTIQFFIFKSHRNLSYLAIHWMQSKDWSDCADTHVDLILPWEPSHFVGFVMRWLSYGKNRLNQQAVYLLAQWLSY